MSKLPSSFDPFIMKDQLLATLKKSPHTSQLVPLRAEEILQIVIEKPIIMELQENIRSLTQKLESEKENRRNLRSDSKRIKKEKEEHSKEAAEMIQKQRLELLGYDQRVQALEQENNELNDTLTQFEETIGKLQQQKKDIISENQALKDALSSQSIKMVELKEQLKHKDIKIEECLNKEIQLQHQLKNNQKEYQAELLQLKEQFQANLDRQISKLKLEIMQKEKINENLREERFTIKNQLNSYKIDLEDLTAVADSLKLEKESLEEAVQQLKQNVKANKVSYERQRKMLDKRLYELSLTYKAHSKLKFKVKKLRKTLHELANTQKQMKASIQDQLQSAKTFIHDSTKSVWDEVGHHIERQLKQLEKRMQLKNQQTRDVETEARNREQSINRLEKQVNTSNRQISDLKTELRQRKRQEERLRRQLKTMYEDSELKLNILQKKYMELLGTN